MGRVLGVLLCLLTVVSMWRIFVKAGRPGWQSLVPGYNIYVIFRMADLPPWQASAFIATVVARAAARFIPGVSGGSMIISLTLVLASAGFWFVACLGLASKFGRGTAFAIGLVLVPFVFFPVLAFGSAPYGEPEACGTLGLSGV
jgi:hypothetical protein